MTYSTLVQRLLHINRCGGMKLGLENVLRLQKLLHFPARSFQSIHIAGTNGKGSVSIKIATALQEAGYRVGLYTSPHLSCFRERIRVNGDMIAEQVVSTHLSRLFDTIEKEHIPATFFELTTCLAFLHFAQEQVEIAVIETGLGGRLDATNVIHPCLSVITSISLDHTEILGSTREEIAKEKGGIIKKQIPVVIGPHVPLAPIQAIALQQQSPLIQVQANSSFFEEENCAMARTALMSLPFQISSEAIERGLKSRQPCRFEVLAGSPTIILDVAHNPNGLHYLFQAIQQHYPGRSLRLLFGLSKNKDLHGCLELIAAHGEHFHLVEAANGRGAAVQSLATHLEKLAINPSRVFQHDSIAAGVQQAQQEACQHNQVLVVCGSFFIMAEVRQSLGFHDPQDSLDMNER